MSSSGCNCDNALYEKTSLYPSLFPVIDLCIPAEPFSVSSIHVINVYPFSKQSDLFLDHSLQNDSIHTFVLSSSGLIGTIPKAECFSIKFFKSKQPMIQPPSYSPFGIGNMMVILDGSLVGIVWYMVQLVYCEQTGENQQTVKQTGIDRQTHCRNRVKYAVRITPTECDKQCSRNNSSSYDSGYCLSATPMVMNKNKPNLRCM